MLIYEKHKDAQMTRRPIHNKRISYPTTLSRDCAIAVPSGYLRRYQFVLLGEQRLYDDTLYKLTTYLLTNL